MGKCAQLGPIAGQRDDSCSGRMEGDGVKFHHATQNGTQFRFIYLLTYLFTYVKTEGEKEEEKQQCVVASCAPPAGDLAHNPGMYPDWELNQ